MLANLTFGLMRLIAYWSKGAHFQANPSSAGGTLVFDG